ncbi:Rieske 2Fe-2S domain-containing protein [Hyphomicrobium sp. LHD-15]|uniref:QcrA and Rieske domain-containing protein n=1 Tax=Hyphomicrobium sp. LHD-15 TaxID=3072142 RepID=UPI00280EDE71|nr:Rieske 2Fe-2S domain-containing protein [Hyphomicrobium sp. LHD-15]MDQ8699540.1 Rieske 2Fe-2S domain-containing protein [Hyphomicrobium sp. LHD-15]
MSKDTRAGHTAGRESGGAPEVGRRTIIQGLAVSGCLAASGLLGSSPAGAQSTRPQPGHHFVFMTGDKEGQPVAPDDVKIGEPPLLAYPMDPATKTVLISRASLLLLMRLKEADLDPSTKPHSADGIVAYSGICTHEGCPISGHHENQRMAVCNCHGSTFDLGNNGAVAHGPAVRRLAMLPVTITDGALVVAGKLDGPIGPPAA